MKPPPSHPRKPPHRSYPDDQSTAIRPQKTTPTRSTPKKPYDAKKRSFMTRIRFVTSSPPRRKSVDNGFPRRGMEATPRKGAGRHRHTRRQRRQRRTIGRRVCRTAADRSGGERVAAWDGGGARHKPAFGLACLARAKRAWTGEDERHAGKRAVPRGIEASGRDDGVRFFGRSGTKDKNRMPPAAAPARATRSYAAGVLIGSGVGLDYLGDPEPPILTSPCSSQTIPANACSANHVDYEHRDS